MLYFPNSKVPGANMGHTWVLAAPDGPHVGPRNFAIWVISCVVCVKAILMTAMSKPDRQPNLFVSVYYLQLALQAQADTKVVIFLSVQERK